MFPCSISPSNCPTIYFNGTKLSYSDQVVHLGHILTSNLDDTADIMRTVKDMNKKANSLLCTFHFVDPQVKTFLLKFYCLSLYGCCLWTLSAPSIRVVEVALNKILRKIWRLPPRSHSAIAHCVAQVDVYIKSSVFAFSVLSFKSYLVFISSQRADMIRYIRTTFGVPSQYENLVCSLSCD